MKAENQSERIKRKVPEQYHRENEELTSKKIKNILTGKEERVVEIKSNDCIFMKVVNSEKEFKDFQNGDMEFAFQPLFTHQLFPNEIIVGYIGLKILISLTPKYFFPHIKIIFKEKTEKNEDIEESLKKFFEDLYLTDDSQFLKILKEELESTEKPKGKLIKKEGNKEIYYIQIIEDNFVKENSPLQLLLKFFIINASNIPLATHWWNYYFVIENQGSNWITLAYCSSKNFHLELEKYITMLSQFLVIPTFQRQGLGKFLLRTMYDILIEDKCCTEITTEDPCIEFILLRDVVISEMILEKKYVDDYLKLLGKELTISKPELYHKFPLDKEFINKITKDFKLQQEYVGRALELILYSIAGSQTIGLFICYKNEFFKKVLNMNYDLKVVSDPRRKGPFIQFDGEEGIHFEALRQLEETDNFGDMRIEEQCQMFFKEYDADVQKIIRKIGRATLERKEKIIGEA
ncbi:MAG: histone acetyltransferase type B catalytic subunit [archaeon]|nr:histone acetyltransferase type B catalytic subunit [archaeon]